MRVSGWRVVPPNLALNHSKYFRRAMRARRERRLIIGWRSASLLNDALRISEPDITPLFSRRRRAFALLCVHGINFGLDFFNGHRWKSRIGRFIQLLDEFIDRFAPHCFPK